MMKPVTKRKKEPDMFRLIAVIASTAGAQVAAAENRRRVALGLPPIEPKPYIPTWGDRLGEWCLYFLVALPFILLAAACIMLVWKITSLSP